MPTEKRPERGKGALQTPGRKGIWAEGTVEAGAGGDERVQPWAFIIAGMRCSQERAHQEGPNLTPLLSACGGRGKEILREGGFNSPGGVVMAQVTISFIYFIPQICFTSIT